MGRYSARLAVLRFDDTRERICGQRRNGRERREDGMSGEDKTARHERAAVAYAHRLVTNANFMWREITGQDIGIDAVVELPYADSDEHGSRGFALVQIKSRTGAVTSSHVSVVYKERHHMYWLTQRLPVILCVVQPRDWDDFSTGIASHWIDYKSLQPDESSVSESQNGKRWTLKVKLDSSHVWPSPGSAFATWKDEAKSFYRWLEGVLVRPAEAMAKTLVDAATDLLGAGKPDRAQAYLGGLPLWEEVLLKEGSRQSLDKEIARVYRRLGAVDAQKKSLNRYRVESRPVPDFMETELALTYWTCACMTPFPAIDLKNWQMALKTLGTPTYRRSGGLENIKGDLVRLGALVNIRSHLSCLPGHEHNAPDQRTCDELRKVINVWRDSKDAKKTEPRFQASLLNALRALCRGYLARGEVEQAELVLREIDDQVKKEPDREVLALTDLFLLTAWVSTEKGKTESAAATLECTRHLLNAMYDPLNNWFRKVVVAKYEAALVPVGPQRRG